MDKACFDGRIPKFFGNAFPPSFAPSPGFKALRQRCQSRASQNSVLTNCRSDLANDTTTPSHPCSALLRKGHDLCELLQIAFPTARGSLTGMPEKTHLELCLKKQIPIGGSSAQATHKQDELGTMGLGVRLPLLRLEELSLEGGGLIRRQVIPEHVSQLGESDATEPSRHVAP